MTLYRHKNCTDTAVEVLKQFYIKEKDAYSLKLSWWNTGLCHAPWQMQITQRVKIDRKTWLNDWRIYE